MINEKTTTKRIINSEQLPKTFLNNSSDGFN